MKKIFLPVLMLLAIILGSMPVTASGEATVDASVGSQLDQNIDGLLNQKGFSGSLLVVKNGKTVYQTSRGYSNFGNGLSNEKNTAYEIDSVQKTLTAALVMKEVQKGKLSLTDKLSKFYPSIPGSNKITIRQMLDMTSGLVLSEVGPDQILPDSGIIAVFISQNFPIINGTISQSISICSVVFWNRLLESRIKDCLPKNILRNYI